MGQEHEPLASRMDGGWKQIVEDLFEEFLRFFFPQVHQTVDFTRPIKFLDQELQRLFGDSAESNRSVDKVAQVHLRDGTETLLLIHVEIQAQPDPTFAHRMYVYHYRLADRHRQPIASLAVLVDDQPGFRPDHYETRFAGTRLRFEFEVVKLIDVCRTTDLASDPSPFAVVCLVQWRKLQARGDLEQLYAGKSDLMRELVRRQFPGETTRVLLRFLDYILRLPRELEQRLCEKIAAMEDSAVEYITSWEQMGIEKGEARMLLQLLEQRFGAVSEEVRSRIADANSDVLHHWASRLFSAERVEDVFDGDDQPE